MQVKYCNADCQKNHWATHKKDCKLRAAELHDEALFKDPPAKEDCPICFLSMPINLVSCVSLPPATITSVPICDYAMTNEGEGLQRLGMKHYYSCCGKSICKGCLHSSIVTGNVKNCPYCKTDRDGKTGEEKIEELMKRVEANDADAMYQMGSHYSGGAHGLQQDQERAMELWKQASQLGSMDAHYFLGNMFSAQGGNLKKAKFHFETAAMAGHEVARYMLGFVDAEEGKDARAVKHWIIAASAGNQHAMHQLREFFKEGIVNRNTIDSTLTAYNNSCAEMRSEARDICIRLETRRLEMGAI